ncbi:MAG: hypothetical protein ACRC1H_17605 [Caldilineaceae bacterium]
MSDQFAEFLRQKLTKAEIAIGMATVLKPGMAITPDDPIGMMEQIVAHVRQREAELTAERDELLHIFGLVIDELDLRHRDSGNAPGHGHKVPGVWDSDNGKLAGKPCAWCALWAKAKQLRAAIAATKAPQ